MYKLRIVIAKEVPSVQEVLSVPPKHIVVDVKPTKENKNGLETVQNRRNG